MIKKNDLIENYIPIYNKDNSIYEINFDLNFDENNDNGCWLTYIFNYKPTFNDIKNVIETYYNDQCKNNIQNSLIWKDMNIILSSENQQNYKRDYDLAVQTNGKNLPLTFKFKRNGENEYYTFNDIKDLEDFYLTVNNHINSCLTECWNKKESINWEDYKF